MLWGLQSELYLPPHFFDDAAATTTSATTTSTKRHVLFQYLKIGITFPRLVNTGNGYENCLRLFCNFTDTSTMHSCFQTAMSLGDEMGEDGEGRSKGDGRGCSKERIVGTPYKKFKT